jgi:hyaluronoglucosaminidase
VRTEAQVSDGAGATSEANVKGIIEGFYGPPWTWQARLEVSRWCASRGMTHYVYAPKDDPKHRDRWREPYDAAELAGFERLVADGALEVGFAISPGLSIDADDDADRAALLAKCEQVLVRGVRLLCLALDDIPFRDGLGEAHARLTAWLHGAVGDRARLLLVPTEYVGSRPTPYLDALAAGVPDGVPIGWTGDAVVNDVITTEQAVERAAALGGRPPLLWDNYPVNDAVMADRLFMGPLRGRDAGLVAACDGYLANPMVQPRASTLPLASIAAWLRGEDPVACWQEEAAALGWQTFAEACDGEVPRELVRAVVAGGDTERLRAWLESAVDCAAPELGSEVEPWLAQIHAEARVGIEAVRLLEASRAGHVDHALHGALKLAGLWPPLRGSTRTVMGARCSFRPALVQRRDGRWAVDSSALTEGENAIDDLVRGALHSASELAHA